MKKILILFTILYSFSANAANLTDMVGAECGSIMIKTVENKIDKLHKCLQTYREIGGNYDELNKRFYRSKVLFDISLSDYIKNLDHSDKKSADTAEMMINIFQNEFYDNMQYSSYDMYMMYKRQYDDLDPQKKDTFIYQRTVRYYEITKKWYEIDAEVEKNKTTEKEPPKKGFFNWFK